MLYNWAVIADTISVYCAQSWRISTWRTTGVWPTTCPPETVKTFDVDSLRAPVVYLRLHGLPSQPYLYGDGYTTALRADDVRESNFEDSVVFLEGCYGVQIADAFLVAGARAVVGNEDATWGRRWRIGPSSRVGAEWLRRLYDGYSVLDAIRYATNEVSLPYSRGWIVQGQMKAKLGEIIWKT